MREHLSEKGSHGSGSGVEKRTGFLTFLRFAYYVHSCFVLLASLIRSIFFSIDHFLVFATAAAVLVIVVASSVVAGTPAVATSVFCLSIAASWFVLVFFCHLLAIQLSACCCVAFSVSFPRWRAFFSRCIWLNRTSREYYVLNPLHGL